jgi:hypothetical protein
MTTSGFMVLSCGHWLHAAVSSTSTFQLDKLVDCTRCGTWQSVKVVTG